MIQEASIAHHRKPPGKIGVLGVIPARLASTRLPRKVLREIAGRPLLAWTYEAALACTQLDAVIVAADSEEVAELCLHQGWPVELTSSSLPSGTDRLHAIAQLQPADIYVNVQADEPMLRPAHIDALLRPFTLPQVELATLKVPCAAADIVNPNAVKVVTAVDGRALYFSRAPIPFHRDSHDLGTAPQYWKHLGLYAYRRAALERFPFLPASPLERAERLEQLRFLEAGMSLYVTAVGAELDTVGVDTEDDLHRVATMLPRTNRQPELHESPRR